MMDDYSPERLTAYELKADGWEVATNGSGTILASKRGQTMRVEVADHDRTAEAFIGEFAEPDWGHDRVSALVQRLLPYDDREAFDATADILQQS